jgi:hypothetical protein
VLWDSISLRQWERSSVKPSSIPKRSTKKKFDMAVLSLCMVLRLFLFTGAEIDGVRITVDVSQTNRGNASFRAFRLSKEFLDAYRKPPFSAKS